MKFATKPKLNQQSKLKILAELELRARQERVSLAAKYEWTRYARAKQLPPTGEWNTWMLLAGRGFGKTRSGAEWVRDCVSHASEKLRIALVGRTPADVRDVLIEGKSGILNITPVWDRPHYEPSKRRITWPNGCTATTYSYENPDQLRGPEHHLAWCDELASASNSDAWDNLIFGMRLGNLPRVLITTTPRPTALIKKLVADPNAIVICGSTYENKDNLPDIFLKEIESKYGGTRLGRQEIFAEILEDMEGALWMYATIERNHLASFDSQNLSQIVVAVDPAASSDKTSDETGIIVCGIDAGRHGYVLADGTLRGSPNERAHEVKRLFEHWKADYVVAEKNNGGDMVEYMLKTVDPENKMPVKLVHASRGKFTRAEPIAALYEQNKISHVGTELTLLADELCSWTPLSTKSPNRLDALVWGFSELMLQDLPSEPSLRMM
jgi:phage terminase large subunit-like protein